MKVKRHRIHFIYIKAEYLFKLYINILNNYFRATIFSRKYNEEDRRIWEIKQAPDPANIIW